MILLWDTSLDTSLGGELLRLSKHSGSNANNVGYSGVPRDNTCVVIGSGRVLFRQALHFFAILPRDSSFSTSIRNIF